MYKSIRARLVVNYSIITLVFTLTLFGVLNLSERQKVLDIALKKSMEVSKLNANLISSEFRKYVTLLDLISGEPRVISGDKAFIVSELSRLVAIGDGAFNNAAYVDQQFNITDSHGVESSLVNHPMTKELRLKRGQYYISPPLIGRFDNVPVVVVSVPILDKSDVWLGNVSVSIPLQQLNNELSRIKLGKGSYAWLANDRGVVIAHPIEDLVMRGSLYNADDLGYTGLSEIAQRALTQTVGYGEYVDPTINRHKIVTFANMDFLPGWTLLVSTEKSVIYEDINAILLNILVTFVGLIIVFMMVVIYLVNNITKPISELTIATRESVKNSFQPIHVVQSDDEIGQLSRAFNETLVQIQHYTHNLEALVEKRTDELNEANADLERANVQLNKKNQILEEFATRDPLTNLYNRRAFSRIAEQKMMEVSEQRQVSSLVLIDIDYFKHVNDDYGHDVGDHVLSDLADTLTENTRKDSIVCRWGGEEFILLLPGTSVDMALPLMERLKTLISEQKFGPIERLTISAGIAEYRGGETLCSWVNRADKVLYEAKNAGRDRIKVAL